MYTGESRTRAALQSVQRIPICWAAELARNASTRGRATVWRSAVLRGTQPCGCMGPVSLPVPALEGSVELALGDAAAGSADTATISGTIARPLMRARQIMASIN